MNITLPKAVLFDWDDTVVQTGDAVLHAVNQTLQHFGRPAWTEEEAREHLGPPARVLFTNLFGEDKWQEADKVYITSYLAGVKDHIRVYDGIQDVFDLLCEKETYLAVVSAKRGPVLRQEAEQLSLNHRFSRLIGSGDAVRDKPYAEAVHLALEGSGIAPGPDVWFIGDRQTDMICANNAGCLPVLIRTNPPPDDVLAQYPPALSFENHAKMLEKFRSLVA
ncbi:MAG: HAD hydrolase-like protein [Alphaproteobacteria bacterium]|nr:HAD hydrolase-like protein [Alphaproteobacteria bacterium]